MQQCVFYVIFLVVEILGMSEIRTSFDGLTTKLTFGVHQNLALRSVIKLKTLPRGTWKLYVDVYSLNSSEEVRTLCDFVLTVNLHTTPVRSPR